MPARATSSSPKTVAKPSSKKPAAQSRAVAVAKTQPVLRTVVKKVSGTHGVAVGTIASNDEHAIGSMSPQRAAEIARRAGIITPAGNLSSLYK